MVVIEKTDDGQWRVYRVLPCLASAEAAAIALERIVPEGFARKAPETSIAAEIDAAAIAGVNRAFGLKPGTPS